MLTKESLKLPLENLNFPENEKQSPIINSQIDLDFYKLTMGQYVWRYHPHEQVTFKLKVRKSQYPLSTIIPLEQLEEEIAHTSSLTPQPDELDFLKNIQNTSSPLFQPDFINFFSHHSPSPINLSQNNQDLSISTTGPWSETIFWETKILSIVNQIYFENLIKQQNLDYHQLIFEGNQRLWQKINILKQYPDIKIIEFGTRRRFSQIWQKHILTTLKEELPQNLVGTSNVLLAKQLNLTPVGTMAHELSMITAGLAHHSNRHCDLQTISKALRQSNQTVLKNWWREFGHPYSIALTDTFGSKFFFKDFTYQQALDWKGLRQDSGDPFEFGHQAIAFYQKYHIDPLTKLIVFSDGLEIDTILKLYHTFKDQINIAFGWGTNLTNDLGLTPLSIVMKPISVNNTGLVKLSDNLAKALGHDQNISLYQQAFDYQNNFYQPCTY